MASRLGELESPGQQNDAALVKECGDIIYRFRSGLWGLICDLFKTPVGSTARNPSSSNSITSADAEDIQRRAWEILSKCVELLKGHSVHPSVPVLKHLNETFCHIQSLKKCPNASTLNTNIESLIESFCRDFRVKAVLEFVRQTCDAAQSELEKSYFDEVVFSLPSLQTESLMNLAELDISRSGSLLTSQQNAKIGTLITEARDAFDAIWNSSMMSSEVKIRLDRASVFSCCCDDFMQQLDAIWKRVGFILLETVEADMGDDAEHGTKTRQLVVQSFERTLNTMLSSFLGKVFDAFKTRITPPTTLAASGRSSASGVRVCTLFAIVSNCIELRDRCLPRINSWFSELKLDTSLGSTQCTTALLNTLTDMIAKCMDMFVTMHVNPLMHILRAGATEAPQQARHSSSSSQLSRTASSRTASLSLSSSESRTSSSADLDFPVSPPSAALAMSNFTSVSTPASSVVPNDPRQYVFNVLLQLITLRSEIETGLGVYPDCSEFVTQVGHPLTAELARFLRESLDQLDSSPASVLEWKQIHVRLTWLSWLSNELNTGLDAGDRCCSLRSRRGSSRWRSTDTWHRTPRRRSWPWTRRSTPR